MTSMALFALVLVVVCALSSGGNGPPGVVIL